MLISKQQNLLSLYNYKADFAPRCSGGETLPQATVSISLALISLITDLTKRIHRLSRSIHSCTKIITICKLWMQSSLRESTRVLPPPTRWRLS